MSDDDDGVIELRTSHVNEELKKFADIDFAVQIYDEYLESIGCEFRTEDMADEDYEDEIDLIVFVLNRLEKKEKA